MAHDGTILTYRDEWDNSPPIRDGEVREMIQELDASRQQMATGLGEDHWLYRFMVDATFAKTWNTTQLRAVQRIVDEYHTYQHDPQQ